MLKTLIITLISFSTMFAQSAGSSGLSFLKLGFGARNIAMGDAGAVSSNDVTALFYNPSRLTLEGGNEIMLMHNEWIQGIRSELLGVKTEIWGQPVAFGFNVTSVNDIEIRTKAGKPDASFNANYFFGSISTSFAVVDNIKIGTSLKYLYEGLLADESTGWGLDLGMNYRLPLNGLSASVVVKNLGSMNKLKNEPTKLPAEIRVGPAYAFSLPDTKLLITTAAEFQKYMSADNVHFNFGTEIQYDKILSLRGGYQSGYEVRGFTGGVGLAWGNLNFDYAVSPFSLGLGTGHSISLSFKF